MNSSFYKNLLDQSWRSRGLHKKIYAGLPHGQKKLKKFKKSGKNRDFEKIQENFFKKHHILSVQIYKIPYIYMPSVGKKLIKSSSKSDEN